VGLDLSGIAIRLGGFGRAETSRKILYKSLTGSGNLPELKPSNSR
jgi:hypothetical protein